jgi:plastocyanin
MKTLASIIAIGAAALAIAVPAGGATIQKRTLTADPDGGLTFDRTKLRAHPGVVKLVMVNPKGSGLPHGIAIKSKKGAIVDPGGTSTVKKRLAKGTYTYYCPFDGHRAAGMKGRLVIK